MDVRCDFGLFRNGDACRADHQKAWNILFKKMGASIWHSLRSGFSDIRLCLKAYPYIAANANTSASLKTARVFCHGTGKYSGRFAWCENTASGGVIHSEHGGQHYGDTSIICIGSADGSRNRMVFYWSWSSSNYLHVLHIRH